MSLLRRAISKNVVKDFRKFFLDQFKKIVSPIDGKTRLSKAVYNSSLINDKSKFNLYFPGVNFELVRALLDIFNKDNDIDMFKSFAKFYYKSANNASLKRDAEAILTEGKDIKATLDSINLANDSSGMTKTVLGVSLSSVRVVYTVLFLPINPLLGLCITIIGWGLIFKGEAQCFDFSGFRNKLGVIVYQLNHGKTPDQIDYANLD